MKVPHFWPRFYLVVLGMTFFFSSANLLFPLFYLDFISIFFLDFYFPSMFGHFVFFVFLVLTRVNSVWLVLIGFDSFWLVLTQSRSHFGFLPNFLNSTVIKNLTKGNNQNSTLNSPFEALLKWNDLDTIEDFSSWNESFLWYHFIFKKYFFILITLIIKKW